MLKKVHKIIGISIALIVIHLAVTGLILMYPKTFGLYDTYFNSNYILSLYKMYKIEDVKTNNNLEEIGIVSSKIIVMDNILETNLDEIIGVYRKDKRVFVMNRNIFLLIEESEYGLKVIDKIELEFEAKRMFSNNKEIILEGVNYKYYKLNENQEFDAVKNFNKSFIVQDLSATNRDLASFYLGLIQAPGVQALRLVTDLHNGRFFGPFVMLIFAFSSFLITFLAISGSYIAITPVIQRRLNKIKKNKNH